MQLFLNMNKIKMPQFSLAVPHPNAKSSKEGVYFFTHHKPYIPFIAVRKGSDEYETIKNSPGAVCLTTKNGLFSVKVFDEDVIAGGIFDKGCYWFVNYVNDGLL